MSQSGPEVVEIQAPAKVNLFLEVLGKRDDGFHEIVTVMQAVDIFDHIRLRRHSEGVTLRCGGPASDSVPEGPENLAFKAAERMIAEAVGRPGVEIDLTKRIPAGGGLGGGSSDAAAVLVGLNRLWDVGLPPERLEGIAAELGSDVAFFVRGGTSLCTGRGEKIKPLASAHVLHYVVATPGFGSQTHRVYEKIRLPLTENVKNVNLLVERWSDPGVDPREIASQLFNRLEEPACELYPGLVSLKERLTRLGCERVLISGSGSCVYGIAAQQEAACEIAGRLSGEGDVAGVDVARSLSAGSCERGMSTTS